MDENKVKSIFNNQIDDYANKNQFGVSKIPIHTHNGTDSVKIYQKNIINNNKYGIEITSLASETFTISNLPNVAQISFNGLASNNAANTSLPGTKKATITGVVQFGNCYGTPRTSGNVNDVQFANAPVEPFLQTTNSMYIDTTDLTKTTVTATGSNLAYVVVNVAGVVTELATLTVNSYTSSTITMTTVLSSGWQITGFVLFF